MWKGLIRMKLFYGIASGVERRRIFSTKLHSYETYSTITGMCMDHVPLTTVHDAKNETNSKMN